MSEFTFAVRGEIRGKMRPKATAFGGHARVFTPSAQVHAEEWIRLEYLKAAESAGFRGFRGRPVSVSISVHRKVPKSMSRKRRELALSGKLLPTTKPDIDNQVKTVLDALNGTDAWDDDSNIYEVRAEKVYDTEDYATITLRSPAWTEAGDD